MRAPIRGAVQPIPMRRSKLTSGSTAPPDARPEPNAWTTPAIFFSLIVISIFSNGNLHPKVLPVSEDSNLQQYIGVGLWAVVIVVSYFRRVLVRLAPRPGLFVALGIYAIAVASPLWSTNFMASLPKATALAIVAFGAYRLTRTFDIDAIIDAVFFGQFFLCVASIAVALFIPDIGVLKTWQHAGQWNGVFYTKQNLGVLAAVFLFFSCYRLLTPQRGLYHALGALVALVCIVMSGSRGGGGLAAFAVGCLYLAGLSLTFTRILAFAPFFMGLVGTALIAYFVKTGNRYLLLFGQEIDFTERTFIWQHALSYFMDRKWLGFGLNGFWTIPEVKDLFTERHGWFLDNYHDGYIAIAMETGATGLAVFLIGALMFGLRILERIRQERRLDPHVALSLVYACLLFFIDFTETFFLRSTNISATMLLTCFVLVYARPAPAPQEATESLRFEEPAPRRSRGRTRMGAAR